MCLVSFIPFVTIVELEFLSNVKCLADVVVVRESEHAINSILGAHWEGDEGEGRSKDVNFKKWLF